MKAAYISAAATILAAIIGGIFLLRSISANQPSVSPTPPSVPITSATTQSQKSASTTPTPTPITENRSIPCSQSVCTVMIVLDTVTIDSSERNMRWTFTLSSGPGCSDGELDLYLEDPSGTKYQAGGDVGPGNPTWVIGPGQSFNVVALFAGLNPARGVTYQLYTGISGMCHAAYQKESFDF